MLAEYFNTIFSVCLSSLIGIGMFIMKHIFNRLEILEKKLDHAVTEADVRAIIGDKVDPIKEDITEIKQAIVKIYELYLNERNR